MAYFFTTNNYETIASYKDSFFNRTNVDKELFNIQNKVQDKRFDYWIDEISKNGWNEICAIVVYLTLEGLMILGDGHARRKALLEIFKDKKDQMPTITFHVIEHKDMTEEEFIKKMIDMNSHMTRPWSAFDKCYSLSKRGSQVAEKVINMYAKNTNIPFSTISDIAFNKATSTKSDCEKLYENGELWNRCDEFYDFFMKMYAKCLDTNLPMRFKKSFVSQYGCDAFLAYWKIAEEHNCLSSFKKYLLEYLFKKNYLPINVSRIGVAEWEIAMTKAIFATKNKLFADLKVAFSQSSNNNQVIVDKKGYSFAMVG